MDHTKEYYTTHETAKLLCVTPTTIINWIKDKKFHAAKTLGGHRRISRKEVEKIKHSYTKSKVLSEKKRILIIDDEESIRIGFKKVLENEGFLVETAANGFEAGMCIYQHKPDLVILDLLMPEMDGFKACKFIKANKGFQKIKILVVTGYPSIENLNKISSLGADRCLAKPIDAHDLIKEIKQLI